MVFLSMKGANYLRTMLFALLFIAAIATVTFASPVSVTNITRQTKYGTLTYVYFEKVSGPSSSTPATNTAQSAPSNSGSYAVARGASAFLWSPQYTTATTISAGKWTLNFWVAGSTSGTMTVSIYITNSAGTIQSTIASNVVTPTISTSKTQVTMYFSGNSATVPSNGYVSVVLSAPSGAGKPSFTVYWGTGQLTDFQLPYRILT